jgi:hypothetical protein
MLPNKRKNLKSPLPSQQRRNWNGARLLPNVDELPKPPTPPPKATTYVGNFIFLKISLTSTELSHLFF